MRERTEARISPATSLTAPLPVLRVEPSTGWVSLQLRELWRYRELIYFLAWRDIKVRYKQTIFGGAWAIMQPLLTMVVFSVFFGRLARMPSDGVPYPIFSYAALVPWGFFAQGLNQVSNSLVNSAALIKKVYFPRMVAPIAAILAGSVDFAITFTVLLGMMVYYGKMPTVNILWLPLLVILGVATSLGVGLWLSALNVQFRDVRHIVPFVIQLWFFCTPITYPSSLLPQPWRSLYGINPMVGVVEGFRWALLGTQRTPGLVFAISALAALMVLASGAFYFRRMEKTFADVV